MDMHGNRCAHEHLRFAFWLTLFWIAQIFNAFDTLKDAWGARKRDIEARVRSMGGAGLFGGGGYGMYGGQGQEMARLEHVSFFLAFSAPRQSNVILLLIYSLRRKRTPTLVRVNHSCSDSLT